MFAFSLEFHAVFSAYLSMCVGIVEATLSIMAGHADISMSLYGVALMAILDVVGSILILALWQCRQTNDDDPLVELALRIKDLRFTYMIGLFMVFMGLFLMTDSAQNLFKHDKPNERDRFMGDIASAIGCICGFGLSIYKYTVGTRLDSPAIVADGVSSLCSAFTSFTALVVSLLEDSVWWADSVSGFAVASYTLYSGITTVIASQKELSHVLLQEQSLLVKRHSTNNNHRGPVPKHISRLLNDQQLRKTYQGVSMDDDVALDDANDNDNDGAETSLLTIANNSNKQQQQQYSSYSSGAGGAIIWTDATISSKGSGKSSVSGSSRAAAIGNTDTSTDTHYGCSVDDTAAAAASFPSVLYSSLSALVSTPVQMMSTTVSGLGAGLGAGLGTIGIGLALPGSSTTAADYLERGYSSVESEDRDDTFTA